MRRLIAFALLLAAGIAAAQPPEGVIINGQGGVELTWRRPTRNEDGSELPVADIAGYSLYYGPQSQYSAGDTRRPECVMPPVTGPGACYAAVREIGDGAQESDGFTLELTQSQTIYFAITATHVNGLKSAYSNEAAKIFTLQISSAPEAPVLESLEVSITCATSSPQVTCSFTVQ